MARTTKPLTNTEVKQAKAKDKVYKLSDGGGLQLRVRPNGTRSWLFDYKKPYSKIRANYSFGSYPSLSLADARIKREEAKELLAKDIDPKEYRDEQNKFKELEHNNTLEFIAANWLETKKSKVSENHAQDTWRSLELHIFPKFGKVPINKITAVKAIEVIDRIAAKASLETVKRICQRLNEVMVYSVNTGLIEQNPLAGIKTAFNTPIKQNYPTLKPEELPSLMMALAIASIKITTRCLIEWQLHTMVRPSEAAGARWEEIDFDNALWNIPAERMKKKKPHTVPLTEQSLVLLDLMKDLSHNSEFIFPSDRDPRKPTNSQTANTALKRMGFHKKLVAHGLRSIARTALNDQGFDEDVIEAALAHVGKNEVRNAYNRSEYIERRKPVMTWWSEFVDEAATGNMSLTGRKALKLVNE